MRWFHFRYQISLKERMKNHHKISIVIPSFNQAKFIEETIHSILDQNYPKLELLVLDAGSTDGSVKVIEKCADRLTYWLSCSG